MPTQVETPSVPHHGAGDAPHHLVRLEDHGVLPLPGQEIGRRQAAGTRAGDDDGCLLTGVHDEGRLVDPLRALVDGRGQGAGAPGDQVPEVVYSVRFMGS